MLLLFGAAYFPVFQILTAKWLNLEEYTHAFFTLPIIFYIIWQKKEDLHDCRPHYDYLGLPIILLSTALYLFSLLTEVHTLIALSSFFTILGTIIYFGGIDAVKILFTPLLLLLILIPIPEQLYTQITFPLQIKVSQASEHIIRMFGVPVFREGNILTISEKSFHVVEACSGLRSAIALLTLSIIMGYFMLKKTWTRSALLAASVPSAIVLNIVRVSGMILLYHFFKLDLGGAAWHTATGVIVFLLALSILFLVQRILEYWEA